MSRAQWLVLIVMVPAIVVGGLVAGRALNHDDTTSGRLQVSSAADATEFEFDFTIPSGTADRIAAGEIEIDLHRAARPAGLGLADGLTRGGSAVRRLRLGQQPEIDQHLAGIDCGELRCETVIG